MPQMFDVTLRLQVETANIQPAVNAIRRQLSGVGANIDLRVDPSASRGINAVTANASSLQANLAAVQKQAAAMNAELRNTRVSPEASRQFQDLGRQIAATSRQLQQTQKATGSASSEMFKFGEQIGLAFRRFLAFQIGAVLGISRLASAIGNAAHEAAEFQKTMVGLSQLGATDSEVQGISTAVSDLSQSLGASSKDLSEATIYLKGAGMSAGEVRSSLEALAKTSLSPTFDSIRETTEAIIAMRQQFGVGAADIEKYLGTINVVSKEFAAESEDMVTAVRRAGAAFKSASSDAQSSEQTFQQFIALFTAVRSTTRESADEISSGLRTIFGRLQSNTVADNLKELGVNLRYTGEEAAVAGRDIQGEFVGAWEAVRRLHDALGNVPTTDPRYAAIVEQVGGFRQISRVIPLIQQFGLAEKAYATAQGGANSLTRDAEKAQGAFLTQLARVREEFLGLIRDIGNSRPLQVLGQTFISLAESLISFGKAIQPVLPLLTALAAVKIGGAIKNAIFPGVAQGVTNVGGATAHAFSRSKSSPAAPGLRDGGPVPGHGTGDIVQAMLPQGAFVIKKGSVRRAGGHAAIRGWAGQGVGGSDDRRSDTHVRLEPGEHVLMPHEVRRVGYGNAHRLNKTGNLPGYASGGTVRGGFMPTLQDIEKPIGFSGGGAMRPRRSFSPAVEHLEKRKVESQISPLPSVGKTLRKLLKATSPPAQYQVATPTIRPVHGDEDRRRLVPGYAEGGGVGYSPLDASGSIADPVVRENFQKLFAGEYASRIQSHLPEGSTFLAHGKDAIAFRTPDGEVVRISGLGDEGRRSPPRPVHPMVLQPKETATYGRHVVERLPYVEPLSERYKGTPRTFTNDPDDERSVKLRWSIANRITKYGKSPYDIHVGNFGFYKPGKGKRGRIVAIDSDTFRDDGAGIATRRIAPPAATADYVPHIPPAPPSTTAEFATGYADGGVIRTERGAVKISRSGKPYRLDDFALSEGRKQPLGSIGQRTRLRRVEADAETGELSPRAKWYARHRNSRFLKHLSSLPARTTGGVVNAVRIDAPASMNLRPRTMVSMHTPGYAEGGDIDDWRLGQIARLIPHNLYDEGTLRRHGGKRTPKIEGTDFREIPRGQETDALLHQIRHTPTASKPANTKVGNLGLSAAELANLQDLVSRSGIDLSPGKRTPTGGAAAKVAKERSASPPPPRIASLLEGITTAETHESLTSELRHLMDVLSTGGMGGNLETADVASRVRQAVDQKRRELGPVAPNPVSEITGKQIKSPHMTRAKGGMKTGQVASEFREKDIRRRIKNRDEGEIDPEQVAKDLGEKIARGRPKIRADVEDVAEPTPPPSEYRRMADAMARDPSRISERARSLRGRIGSREGVATVRPSPPSRMTPITLMGHAGNVEQTNEELGRHWVLPRPLPQVVADPPPPHLPPQDQLKWIEEQQQGIRGQMRYAQSLPPGEREVQSARLEAAGQHMASIHETITKQMPTRAENPQTIPLPAPTPTPAAPAIAAHEVRIAGQHPRPHATPPAPLPTQAPTPPPTTGLAPAPPPTIAEAMSPTTTPRRTRASTTPTPKTGGAGGGDRPPSRRSAAAPGEEGGRRPRQNQEPQLTRQLLAVMQKLLAATEKIAETTRASSQRSSTPRASAKETAGGKTTPPGGGREHQELFSFGEETFAPHLTGGLPETHLDPRDRLRPPTQLPPDMPVRPRTLPPPGPIAVVEERRFEPPDLGRDTSPAYDPTHRGGVYAVGDAGRARPTAGVPDRSRIEPASADTVDFHEGDLEPATSVLHRARRRRPPEVHPADLPTPQPIDHNEIDRLAERAIADRGVAGAFDVPSPPSRLRPDAVRVKPAVPTEPKIRFSHADIDRGFEEGLRRRESDRGLPGRRQLARETVAELQRRAREPDLLPPDHGRNRRTASINPVDIPIPRPIDHGEIDRLAAARVGEEPTPNFSVGRRRRDDNRAVEVRRATADAESIRLQKEQDRLPIPLSSDEPPAPHRVMTVTEQATHHAVHEAVPGGGVPLHDNRDVYAVEPRRTPHPPTHVRGGTQVHELDRDDRGREMASSTIPIEGDIIPFADPLGGQRPGIAAGPPPERRRRGLIGRTINRVAAVAGGTLAIPGKIARRYGTPPRSTYRLAEPPHVTRRQPRRRPTEARGPDAFRTFSYDATDHIGTETSGDIQARSTEEASTFLRDRDLFSTGIRERRPSLARRLRERAGDASLAIGNNVRDFIGPPSWIPRRAGRAIAGAGRAGFGRIRDAATASRDVVSNVISRGRDIASAVGDIDVTPGRNFGRRGESRLYGRIRGGLAEGVGRFGIKAHDAGFIGAAFVPQILEHSYGTVDAPRGTREGAKYASAFGGAVSYGAIGAQAGMIAGPQGAAIGALVGGIYGYTTSLKEAENRIKEIDFEKAFTPLQAALAYAASSTEKVGASMNQTVSMLLSMANKEATRRSEVEGGGNIVDRTLGDNTRIGGALSYVGLGAARHAATGLLGRGAEQIDRENAERGAKQRREILTPQIPQFQQIGDRIASELRLSPEDVSATPGASQAELDLRRQSRVKKFQDAGGKEIAQTIADVQGIPIRQVYEQFDRMAVSSNRLRMQQESQEKAISAATIDIRRFQEVGDAVRGASDSLHGLQSASANLASVFEGQISTAKVGGYSAAAGNLGGLDREAFQKSVKFTTGQVGGPAVAEFGGLVTDLDRAMRDLPGAISRAPLDLGEPDALKGGLAKTLAEGQGGVGGLNLPLPLRQRLATAVEGTDPEELRKGVASDPQKLAETLIRRAFGDVDKVFADVTHQLEERANQFSQGLTTYSQMVQRTGESRDREAHANLGVTRARAALVGSRQGRGADDLVTLEDTLRPSRARQERLAGGDAYNPAAIANRLTASIGRARGLQERISNVHNEPGDQKAALTNLVREYNAASAEVSNLQQALQHLAESSEETAAVQERLNQVEKQRQGQLSYTEKLITADPRQIREMQHGAQAADVAVGQGGFAGFSPRDIQSALEHLRSLQDVRLPGYGGRTGGQVAENLVAGANREVFGRQATDVEGQRDSLLQQQERIAQTAADAQQKITEQFGTTADAFLKNLQEQQAKFLQELGSKIQGAFVANLRGAEDRARTTAKEAQGRVDTIQGVERTSGLPLEQVRKIVHHPRFADFRDARQQVGAIADARRKLIGGGGKVGDLDEESARSPKTVFGRTFTAISGKESGGEEAYGRLREELLAASPDISERTNNALSRDDVDRDLVPKVLGSFRTFRDQKPADDAQFDIRGAIKSALDASLHNAQGAQEERLRSSRKEVGTAAFGPNRGTTGYAEDRLKVVAENSEPLVRAIDSLRTGVATLSEAMQKRDASEANLAQASTTRAKAERPVVAETRASGGVIFRPRGTDTVPTMLTPGEFVVNAASSRRNMPLLKQINSGARYYAGGGEVEDLDAIIAGIPSANVPYGQQTGTVADQESAAGRSLISDAIRDNDKIPEAIKERMAAAERAKIVRTEYQQKTLVPALDRAVTADREAPNSYQRLQLTSVVPGVGGVRDASSPGETPALPQPIDAPTPPAPRPPTPIAPVADVGDEDTGSGGMGPVFSRGLPGNRRRTMRRRQAAIAYNNMMYGPGPVGLPSPRVAIAASTPDVGMEIGRPSPRQMPGNRRIMARRRQYAMAYQQAIAGVPGRMPTRMPRPPISAVPGIGVLAGIAETGVSRGQVMPGGRKSAERRRRTSIAYAADREAYRSQVFGQPLTFASGGMVPTMTSPGEFVVRPEAAAANPGILKQINSGRSPAYRQAGGPVGGAATPPPSSPPQIQLSPEVKGTLDDFSGKFSEVVGNLGGSLGQLSSSASALAGSLGGFNDAASSLARSLANASIPSKIEVATRNEVVLTLNGGGFLTALKGDMVNAAIEAIQQQLPDQVRKIIESMPPKG